MAELLRDRYELLEVLGEGGEGRVVKALDHQHDRFVALKIRSIRTASEREALLSEARVLLAIPPNPHVPLVRDDFFTDDQYVIAMDWVEGTDLDRLLHARGRPGLGPSVVLRWLADAATALTHLHAQHPPVVHGDVKPANLVLTESGQVVLVDFGLSSSRSSTRRRMGTSGFAAPELVATGQPSRASDVYSLAATAFALLTGEAPTGVRPSWEGVDPEQAAQLEAAVRSGLSTDPAKRPESAGELVERLRAGWQESLPTGVLTFCLTDIVGSTAKWESRPGDMVRSLAVHDDLVADAAERYGGRFLEAQGEGDSTVTMYPSPVAAVRAAIDVVNDLAHATWPGDLPLEVRVGIHTGETDRRRGDYVGTTLNLAARLRGLGDAGEILVSHVTADLVAQHLPDGVGLVGLGPHRLRGLHEPEDVFAIAAAGVRTPPPPGDCPYPGLLAFTAADAERFFGREQVIDDIIERLAAHPFLAVVGASGSGKSSVLRAGVVPRLGHPAIVTPGTQPLRSLDGVTGPLVVDQFEELFTLGADADERTAFLDRLLAWPDPVVIGLRADFYGACAEHSSLAAAVARHQVLLGPMTTDELRRAITEPATRARLRIEPGLVDVLVAKIAGEPGALPLLSHALRSTWEARDGRTLTLDGYRSTGGVEGAIAATADGVVDALDPEDQGLARHLFVRLVEPGDGTADTRRRAQLDELVPADDDRDRMGAVLGAVAAARLVTMDDTGVELAHEALIREWPRIQAWIDEDRDGLRVQRHLTAAATTWAQLGEDPSELYRGARLATAVDWARTDPPISALERRFLDESTEVEEADRRAIEAAAAARERANRRLRVLLGAVGAALLLALLTGALALRQRDRANSQTDRAREASVSAEVNRIVAEVPRLLERDRTLAALLAVEAVRRRPTPAARGALLSTLTDEPRLRFTLDGGREGYFSSAAVPEDDRVFAAGPDGVDRWDMEARRLDGGFEVGGTSALAVSADGALIATGTLDGSVVFWDGDTLEATGDRLAFDDRISGLSFSPDGRTLAVATGVAQDTRRASAEQAPRLIDLTRLDSEATALGGHERTVNAVLFSPDGRFVATGGNDGRVVLHDADTGAQVGDPIDLGFAVYRLAFSPDSRLLAMSTFQAMPDGRVAAVYDLEGRRVDLGLTGTDAVTSVGFTADGSQLLVSSGTVQAWNTDDWTAPGPPILSQHGPADVVSLPEHPILVTGTDGTITSWDLAGVPLVAQPVPGSPGGGGVFSPDGTTIVTVDNADRARVYRAEDLAPRATLSVGEPGARGDLDGPTPVAFSPDGALLALGDRFGRVRLFDATTLDPVGPAIEVGVFPVVTMTFSPDSRLLVTTHNLDPVDGARMLDVETGSVDALDPGLPFALSATFTPDGSELVVTTGSGGARRHPVADDVIGRGTDITALAGTAAAAAFSPDGTVLVVGTLNGSIELLDPDTFESVGDEIAVSPAFLASVSFDDRGTLVAAQDLDAAIRLVDVDAGATLGEALTGSGRGYGIVDFAPDGGTVLLPGPSASLLVDLDIALWSEQACALAGRRLTRAEWQEYLPSSGDYDPTC